MSFHSASYEVFIFLGDSSVVPLWHWEQWRQLVPEMNALLENSNGPISVQSFQLDSQDDQIKFGRLGWNEKSHLKWTHHSPTTDVQSADWSFNDVVICSPSLNVCERENKPPEMYFCLFSAGTKSFASYDPIFLMAIDAEIVRKTTGKIDNLIFKIRELMKPVLTARQCRSWAKPWMGMGYTDNMQHLHVTGLFKVGPPKGRPVDLDMFCEKWELF